MGYRIKLVRICSLFIAVLCMPFLGAAHSFAAEGSPVKLDADVISFEESTGIATAEGNVRMSNDEFRATAPYLEYDNNSQQVTAFSTPEQKVTVLTAGKRLTGDKLEYNLASRRGRMINPNGKVDVFYVKGREIDVMPSSQARSGLESSGTDEDDLAAVWRNAILDTCGEPHPHYRLEARRVTIYPGKKMVLHVPKVFVGSVMVFMSPLEIAVPLNDKKTAQKIFPHLAYEENKGVGLGIGGSFNWNSGDLDMDFIGWSKGFFEMDAIAKQELAPNFSVYAGLRRTYNEDMDETDWRPRWGANYSLKGWGMSVGWTRRELRAVEKRAGSVSRYIIERDPEINITSPWFSDPAVNGRFRVFGVWGNYRDIRWDEPKTYGRVGLGVQITGEPGARKNFTPFYNVRYTHYLYDDDIYDEQQVLHARMGVLFSIGRFDFKTAYRYQWVWGRSPMKWDNNGTRDELYQEIGLTIPTKLPAYYWNIGVRAAYDFKSSEMAEMVYKLAYNHHCLLWEAVYRNDLRGDNDWIGLTLSVKDLPTETFRLFGADNNLSDPFAH